MGVLRETKKNIPILLVAGVTVVSVMGVRSKRITKQIHLSFLINNTAVSYTHLDVYKRQMYCRILNNQRIINYEDDFK